MREERIPTMPQGSERIPTMPQGSERIPTMPQGSERIPTMPQGSERIPAIPQNEGRVPTVPQSAGRTATVPQTGYGGVAAGNVKIVGVDQTFTGVQGGRFTIHASQVISADSGESQIFGCTQAGYGAKFVARVLTSITPDSSVENLIRREKVIEFLLHCSRNPKSHILPLIDHGKVQIGGREYFVEVYPFCENGDLGRKKGQIPYRTLRKDVIPAINEALNVFHQAGFVHRDLKPENLYFYNGRVVLGDFGITCEIVNDYAVDTTKTGTLGYYAPELLSQAAVRASDYYSFGQTLWTLYSGEMMYRNILRRYASEGLNTQRNQINNAMMKNVYYGLDEIPEEEHFFEILIRGLLQYDVNSRFDYSKVNRWLKDDYSLAHEISNYQDLSTYPVPFRKDGKQYWSHSQLFSGLRNDWEGTKDLLYSGEFRAFFEHINPRLANEIDQLAKRFSKSSKNKNIGKETMYDTGVAQLFLLLNKGECLVWGDVSYNSLRELGYPPVPAANITQRYHASETGFLQSGIVLDWYQMWQSEHRESVDEYVLKCLLTARDYALGNGWDADIQASAVAGAIVRHVFRAVDGKSSFENCENLEELTGALCGRETSVHAYMENDLLNNPEFYGFLFAQGYADFADSLLKNRCSIGERVNLLFLFLEQQETTADGKDRLVRFYRNHGPEAHLLWLQNNLDLYEFNGANAGKMRETIANFRVEGATVAEVQSAYAELQVLVTKFRTLFVDNVYLAQMGLTGGKELDGITSKHLFAYWHKRHWGQDVPIGFDIS